MTSFKLANVIAGQAGHAFQAPALYCRSTAPFHGGGADGRDWVLSGPGTFDFTTYFNALSVRKWRRYTCATEFGLHLEVKGACTVRLTSGDSFGYEPVVSHEGAHTLDDGDWQVLDLAFSANDTDIVLGFLVEAAGEVRLRNSYYFACVEESQLRDVDLALCMTTFLKEDYVVRNVELLRDRILASDEPVASHLNVHIVDNGRTLDAAVLEGERVYVHANPNVGGSGGFARGMLEASAQSPRATHVLLMDDDVEVSPESVVRTYNLLRLVKDDYEDAFLSGAMMRVEQPSVRHEDIAFFNRFCQPVAVKEAADMCVFEHMVNGEVLEPHPENPGWEDQAQQYAAWWYCVVPMRLIDKMGLPMPLFVRYDDVEFGLRCKPRIMTMNGICVWHLSFDKRENPAVGYYQSIRNGFILKDVADINSDMMGRLNFVMSHLLGMFSYASAELALSGFEDYLKGPEWLMYPSNVEKAFIEANGSAEKLRDLDSLREEVYQVTGFDITGCTSADVRGDIPWSDEQSAEFFATYNGQLGKASKIVKLARELRHAPSPEWTPAKESTGKLAASDIAIVSWIDDAPQLATAYGKRALVAIDPYNRRGVLRVRDCKRFAKIWKRYQRDLAEYEHEHERLQGEYRAAAAKMATREFWNAYLFA